MEKWSTGCVEDWLSFVIKRHERKKAITPREADWRRSLIRWVLLFIWWLVFVLVNENSKTTREFPVYWKMRTKQMYQTMGTTNEISCTKILVWIFCSRRARQAKEVMLFVWILCIIDKLQTYDTDCLISIVRAHDWRFVLIRKIIRNTFLYGTSCTVSNKHNLKTRIGQSVIKIYTVCWTFSSG